MYLLCTTWCANAVSSPASATHMQCNGRPTANTATARDKARLKFLTRANQSSHSAGRKKTRISTRNMHETCASSGCGHWQTGHKAKKALKKTDGGIPTPVFYFLSPIHSCEKYFSRQGMGRLSTSETTPGIGGAATRGLAFCARRRNHPAGILRGEPRRLPQAGWGNPPLQAKRRGSRYWGKGRPPQRERTVASPCGVFRVFLAVALCREEAGR